MATNLLSGLALVALVAFVALVAGLYYLATKVIKPKAHCEHCGKAFETWDNDLAVRPDVDFNKLCSTCYYVALDRKCDQCHAQPVHGIMYEKQGFGLVCSGCHSKK